MASMRSITALLLGLILLCAIVIPSHRAVADRPPATAADSPTHLNAAPPPQKPSQVTHKIPTTPAIVENMSYIYDLGMEALYYIQKAKCNLDPSHDDEIPTECTLPDFMLEEINNDVSNNTLCHTGVYHKRKIITAAFYTNLSIDPKSASTNEKVSYSGNCEGQCMVNEMLYMAYQELRDVVVKRILALRHAYPNYNLLFTGHSLGAALARLCAADLATFPTPNSHLTSGPESSTYEVVPSFLLTFRPFHVGNKGFVKWANHVLSNTINYSFGIATSAMMDKLSDTFDHSRYLDEMLDRLDKSQKHKSPQTARSVKVPSERNFSSQHSDLAVSSL